MFEHLAFILFTFILVKNLVDLCFISYFKYSKLKDENQIVGKTSENIKSIMIWCLLTEFIEIVFLFLMSVLSGFYFFNLLVAISMLSLFISIFSTYSYFKGEPGKELNNLRLSFFSQKFSFLKNLVCIAGMLVYLIKI